jgi:hypothetical protein
MSRILIFLALPGLLVIPAIGQQPGEQKMPPEAAKAQELIKAHLAQINGKNGNVLWIQNDFLAKTFPKHTFFAVRFRIYPVAMQMPEGMKPSNVFAVKDGKFEQIKDGNDLAAFFMANAVAASSQAAGEAAAKSALLLSEEFVQDGFYVFDIQPKADALTVRKETNVPQVADWRAIVMKGGNGELKVQLKWDDKGTVVGMSTAANVKAGPRPICQATKLLDPDPIVRKMAEQDLLYMGLAARDYIMEQRAAANPDLRQAIDALWGQILQNGW